MICYWPITNMICKKIEEIGFMQVYQYFDISFFQILPGSSKY